MIRKLLADEHEVEVAETSRRGHATRLAHAAANDGFDVVAVLAGDGTLNEAADGLLQRKHRARAAARRLDERVRAHARLPERRASRAPQVVLASLRRDATKRIGVGDREPPAVPLQHRHRLRRRGDPARRALRELKRIRSHPLHIAAAFEAFFAAKAGAPHVDIELDTGEMIEGVRFAIVSKTDPYTFLGRLPLHVAPEAGLERPLALTAFRSLDSSRCSAAAVSAMRNGKFLAHRSGIDHRGDIHRIIVRSAEPFAYQVDGDDIGDTQQLDIEYEPDALDDRRSLTVTGDASAASATSGTLVMIASTPACGQRDDLVGLVDGPHVDRQTLRRARRARRRPTPRARADAIGVQPRVPVLGRERRRGGELLAVRQPRGRELGRERAARVDCAEVERRDDHVDAARSRIVRRRPRARRRASGVSASGSHGST